LKHGQQSAIQLSSFFFLMMSTNQAVDLPFWWQPSSSPDMDHRSFIPVPNAGTYLSCQSSAALACGALMFATKGSELALDHVKMSMES
jgi:hypothetical protein